MPSQGVCSGRTGNYLLGGAFVLPPPEALPVVLGQPPGPFDPPPLFPPPPLLPPPLLLPEPLPPPPPPFEPLLIVSSLGLQNEMTAPQRAGPRRAGAA